MKKNLMVSLKVLIVVQARLSSVRMPEKVLVKIGNLPSLKILFYRLNKVRFEHTAVLAIPESSENDKLENWAKNQNINVFRGAEFDVLKRIFDLSDTRSENIIVRITGDCPFIDYKIIETCLQTFINGKFDYLRTAITFPDGLDVEVFTKAALIHANKNAETTYDREHVTPFIRQSSDNKVGELNSNIDLSDIRITLDEPDDLLVLSKIAEFFGHFDFTFEDITNLARLKPSIFKLNSHLGRNEGAIISTGEKLWKRAQKSIAGGNMLLSKRPDMFLKSGWPTYFSKTSGCHVWDLDGKKFTDVSLMGVGTNILGYSHPKVDEAVRKVIDQGNLSTLNAPEEVYLAEKLISLHPWASKVKFARTGGEANAIAIRLARASTGRDKIAFCGYHGWHDWYLAANLTSGENLDNHLLPGLKFAGVPQDLINSSLPFHFNKIEELSEIIRNNDLAAVVMEVMRNEEPSQDYLNAIRKLTKKNGIALIFDECTSGFRETYGGLHLKYGVNPDVATFGKTLGNGYAITAVVGIDGIMDATNKTFISSTFWTERIGSAAALATLEIMQSDDVFSRITEISLSIRKNLTEIAENSKFKIDFFGLPSLSRIALSNFEDNYLKTYITKEMLKLNYLASNMFYVSIAHVPNVLKKYYSDLNSIFKNISGIENKALINLVKNDVASEGFKRLN